MRAEKRYWLDKKRNVDKLVGILVLVCIGLFGADFFYHKHVHFAFEGWFGFFAWYGFISYLVIVLAAKQWRKIVKRDEDYYD
jgi:hypothetical protein